MSQDIKLSAEKMVLIHKALSDETRLRIIVLLKNGEINIKDLCDILDQSQPRISRHVKILAEAGLLIRSKQGAWLYCALNNSEPYTAILHAIYQNVDLEDPDLTQDHLAFQEVLKHKAKNAEQYFQDMAQNWDRVRAMQISDSQFLPVLRNIVMQESVETLLDVGTGTGQILHDLEGLYARGVGIDLSAQMLELARSRANSLQNTMAQFRQENILSLSKDFSRKIFGQPNQKFDLVIAHQVLHFIPKPELAIKHMAMQVKDGGRLILVDYLPHQLHFLCDDYHHIWMGFEPHKLENWVEDAGLEADRVKVLRSVTARHQFSNADLKIGIWIGYKS